MSTIPYREDGAYEAGLSGTYWSDHPTHFKQAISAKKHPIPATRSLFPGSRPGGPTPLLARLTCQQHHLVDQCRLTWISQFASEWVMT
jgi:hypothetical protein